MTKGNGKPCKKCGTSDWADRGNCLQCSRDRANKWYSNNKDRHRANAKAWEGDNYEKSLISKRKWRRANPKKQREAVANWEKRNSSKMSSYRNKRRTAKTKAGGSFTYYEWDQLVKQQNGRCLACGKKQKLAADHIIPVVKGGTSNIDNIQGLCKSCNSKKGIKTTDYRKQKGVIRWIQDKLF